MLSPEDVNGLFRFHEHVGIDLVQHAAKPLWQVVEQVPGFVADPDAVQSSWPQASVPLRVQVQSAFPSQKGAPGVH